MKSLRLIFILFVFTSCQNDKPLKNHLEEFKREFDSASYVGFETKFYKMLIPKDWKTSQPQGIDSFVIRYVTSDSDTIYSDFGWYSNNLIEYENENVQIDYFLIDNYKSKIIQTKNGKNKIVGVYIENLWKEGKQKVHFNFYGTNLSEKSTEVVLNAISNLKFKR